MGKMCQVMKRHDDAVKYFTSALDASHPHQGAGGAEGAEEGEGRGGGAGSESHSSPFEALTPFVLFRRAWSFKALSRYELAGGDFEAAKRMRKEDPNFAVDYKKSHLVEYIELLSEPDIIESFPALLAVTL